MAMNENTMAALVKANVQAISNYPETGVHPIFSDDRVLQAFCKGIIDHIKAAMVVTSSGGDPQGGTVTSTSTTVV